MSRLEDDLGLALRSDLRRAWLFDVSRLLALVATLSSVVVWRDLSATLACGLVFVGLCCWKDA